MLLVMSLKLVVDMVTSSVGGSSTIGGGSGNYIGKYGSQSVIGGGSNNSINGYASIIGGGDK